MSNNKSLGFIETFGLAACVAAADAAVSVARRVAVSPKRTDNVDTTLSFAMKPETRAVTILQSPKPRGAKSGAIQLAICERMDWLESVTTVKWKLKVCRNQMTIDAAKITVKAR